MFRDHLIEYLTTFTFAFFISHTLRFFIQSVTKTLYSYLCSKNQCFNVRLGDGCSQLLEQLK